MQDLTPSNHAYLSTAARCLSGDWLIDSMWLYQNVDLMARADRGEDMSAHWPQMSSTYMLAGDGGFFASDKSSGAGAGQAIGVLSVIGPVYKYGGYNSTSMLIQFLKQLAKDDQVGAVKIIMDSPGGQNAGTRDAFEAIRDFPKPLMVEVRGYMLSAGLYIAAGADKIVCTQPTDLIGSLGTYNTVADWNAYWESMGLKFYETYAVASTEKNEEFRQIIDSKGAKRDLNEKYLAVLNNYFTDDVKSVRGKQLSDKVTKGRAYFALEGIEMGLADELISQGETLGYLADMQRTTKQSTIQMSNFKDFLGAMGNLVTSAQKDIDKPDPAAAAPTVEQLTAQLNTVTAERDTAQNSVATLNGQITQLTTERDAAQTSVTTLTTERDGLKTKVEQYGAQPGAMATQVQKVNDPAPEGTETKTWQEVVAGLEHNKAADGLFE